MALGSASGLTTRGSREATHYQTRRAIQLHLRGIEPFFLPFGAPGGESMGTHHIMDKR